ncbi:hypothetical protein OP10G_3606 [Fimbriimonas ginsengisoli Gsoil 348]|uniref:Uncharacterized protein n=2 Tax=Fimbriimonas ginsengisoli TaxID=1005039 RepID=A0A068NYH7_FIMGI|nr:hypothetical protein OP10G_3606 [Fimbriimonas ginsengisoli Gsoil 348]
MLPMLSGGGADDGGKPPSFFPSQLNLSAPASAALTVLGVSTTTAKPVTNLQQAALSIVNSFSKTGSLQSGFAYTAQEFNLMPASNNQLFPHRDASGNWIDPSRFGRIIRFSNFAVAGVKGTGKDTSARAAASWSFAPIDRKDWRFDHEALAAWQDTASPIVAKFFEYVAPANPGYGLRVAVDQVKRWKGVADYWATNLKGTDKTTFADLAKKLDEDASIIKPGTVAEVMDPAKGHSDAERAAWNEANTLVLPFDEAKMDGYASKPIGDILTKIEDTYNKWHWNDVKADISAAYTWFTPDASSSSLKGEGKYVFATLSGPLFEVSSPPAPKDATYWPKSKLYGGEFTLFAAAATNDLAYDSKTNVWTDGDSVEFGARVQGGSANGGMFAEYLQKTLRPSAGGHTTSQAFQLGYECKLGNGQWFQVAAGPSTGGLFSKVIFGLNFSFNTSPTRGLDENGNPAKTDSSEGG